MILSLEILFLLFEILRAANFTNPICIASNNKNGESIYNDSKNYINIASDPNSNIVCNDLCNSVYQSPYVMIQEINSSLIPRYTSDCFYSYEIIAKWLDDYSFRSLWILEDIKRRNIANLVTKDPNEDVSIEINIEFMKNSAKRVWKYMKAIENCVPSINKIKESRLQKINSFFAKILSIKTYLVDDPTSWKQIDKSYSKKHCFLKDHNDYEAKTSLSYRGYQFYRRKSNPACVLIAHNNSYISEGFKFGNCVIVDEGTLIYKNVTIGNGTLIGNDCVIGFSTEIGNDCVLAEHIKIGEFVSIGNKNIFLQQANVAKCTLKDRSYLKDTVINHHKKFCDEKFQYDSQIKDVDGKKPSLFKVSIGNENIFDTSSSINSFTMIMNNNYFGEYSHIYSFTSIQSYNFFYNYCQVFPYAKIGNNNIFHIDSRIDKSFTINDFTIYRENMIDTSKTKSSNSGRRKKSIIRL